MLDIKELVKDIDATILEDELNSAEISGFYDTGSYLLNAGFSGNFDGGVPSNKITVFAGEEATGKTFFVLNILHSFLKKYPNGIVVYNDTESAVTKDIFESHGIDSSKIMVVEPETIEDFRKYAIQILSKYKETPKEERPPMIIVLDSLGNLGSRKEMLEGEKDSGVQDMTKAKVIRSTFRILNLRYLAKLDVPLFITNHLYTSVGSFITKAEMGGGGGIKYNASSIVFLSKKKDKDNPDDGNLITATFVKSRLTKEKKKVEVSLSYSKGLSRYHGLIDLGEKYDIIKRVGNRYQMGEKTVPRKTIMDNPKTYFSDEIMKQLEEAAKKEFYYGSAIENMNDGEKEINDS